MNSKFKVGGMTCSACQAHVQKAVEKLDGVNNANVNLLSGSMYVDFNENKTSEKDIINSVADAGYTASVWNADNAANTDNVNNTDSGQSEIKSMKNRVIISFCFLIPLMIISMHHMIPGFSGTWLYNILNSVFGGEENAITYALSQFILLLPIAYVNRKFFINGFKTLFKGSPNMDTLIAIGSSAAGIYGIAALFGIGWGLGHNNSELVHRYMHDLYFESSAMILTLITFGKYLEALSKGKTTEAVRSLIDLAPKTAIVIRDGVQTEIAAKDVRQGDLLMIKPGMQIPADGVVAEGIGSVDESALTGESIPVSKNTGDSVMSASVNKSGSFTMIAEKVGEETTLSQIVRLVEDAANSKPAIAKLADKVSSVFVPTVMCIAALTFIIWLIAGKGFGFSLSMGICVLVISCPCALGLATPVAVMVGTGAGAKNGILIKSAESLESIHKINCIALDKTGTVTEGKPVVTDIDTKLDRDEFMKIVYSLESMSEHPLAEALIKYMKENNIPLVKCTDFVNTAGKGIEGIVDGKKYYGGNARFLKEKGFDFSENQKYSEEGKTVLYFADENGIIGAAAEMDILKKDSIAACEKLKKLGLSVVVLTGDNKRTAEAVCRDLNADRIIAEVLPQDKEGEIRKLQEEGKIVAMVGDGINDAPALTRANVGIAVGGGSDIAVESADIVLMKNSVMGVAGAKELGDKVIANIKWNLFWAFFYNCIGIPLAAGVFYNSFGIRLNPMIAALAMSLSSVCVVTNALRLKFVKFGDTSYNEKYNKNYDDSHKKEVINMTKEFNVEGMMCGHCEATVTKAVTAISGVENVKADHDNNLVTVTYSGDIADSVFKSAIEDAGYNFIGKA